MSEIDKLTDAEVLLKLEYMKSEMLAKLKERSPVTKDILVDDLKRVLIGMMGEMKQKGIIDIKIDELDIPEPVVTCTNPKGGVFDITYKDRRTGKFLTHEEYESFIRTGRWR